MLRKEIIMEKLYEVDKVLPIIKELISDGYCPKTDNPNLNIDCDVGGQCCRDCWYDRLIQVVETGGEL
jgi:hypothetical protein